jgi:hypothetical protein
MASQLPSHGLLTLNKGSPFYSLLGEKTENDNLIAELLKENE